MEIPKEWSSGQNTPINLSITFCQYGDKGVFLDAWLCGAALVRDM